MHERGVTAPRGRSSIAYVLKGYPRVSEIFIASEIYRLEQAGQQLELFVIKPADEDQHHPVVDRIRAMPRYLPPTTSSPTMAGWLAANGARFIPALGRTLRRRPAGVARAAAAAAMQAVRARRTFRSKPKKVYLREFFIALALADQLLLTPDVVHLHAHFCHGSTTVTWLASLITGLPFSFTAHAKDIYSPSLNPAGLLRCKLDAARFAVTCTEANREYLARLGSRTPVYAIRHGLNADFSRLLAQTPNDPPLPRPVPDGCLRVLGVGRLVPKKGFDVFVRACAILERRGVPFEALIVGEDGEHGDELRRLIAALGLHDRIRLAGPLGQAELLAEYRRASVCCLPCRVLDDGDRDGFPNVLGEAMACRVPIVTTGISGIPELVKHEVNGLLVAPDDPEAVAGALQRLAGDPALAQRLGAAGAQTIRRNFDGDRLAQQLAGLFRHMVHIEGTGGRVPVEEVIG